MSAGYFHFSMSVEGRKSGKSGVGFAAYISGQSLHDRTEGTTWAFPKEDRIRDHGIETAKDAPEWLRRIAEARDHGELWNRVEEREELSNRRATAQIYRNVEASIDDGLFVRQKNGRIDAEASKRLQVDLIKAHIRENYTDKGMAASWALHWDPKDPTKNPHCHIMLTLRETGEEGFGKKARDWNERGLTEHSRRSWEQLQNAELARLGRNYRVDRRSYKEQGIEGLEFQEKHYGHRAATREANERRLREQGERLIGNPKAVFNMIDKAYITAFDPKELDRHARRFAADEAQAKRLREAIEASKELVRLADGRATTQNLIAKQMQTELRHELGEIGSWRRWEQADEALWKRGYKVEAVRRDDRMALDIVSLANPEMRTSAFRVDRRFGSSYSRTQFGESRVKYELRCLREEKQAERREVHAGLWRGYQRVVKRQSAQLEAFYETYRETMREAWKDGHSGGEWTLGGYIFFRVTKWLMDREKRRMREREQEERRQEKARIDRAKMREWQERRHAEQEIEQRLFGDRFQDLRRDYEEANTQVVRAAMQGRQDQTAFQQRRQTAERMRAHVEWPRFEKEHPADARHVLGKLERSKGKEREKEKEKERELGSD